MYVRYNAPYEVIDGNGTVYFDLMDVISEQFDDVEIEAILNKAGFEIIDINKGKIYYMITAVKKENN